MIVYSVTIHLAPRVEAERLDWMKAVHIPDVLRTCCFTECRMLKALDSSTSEVTYQLHYRCRTLSDYERYRDTHAAALQKEHTDRFAGAFRGSRQVLEVMWEAAS